MSDSASNPKPRHVFGLKKGHLITLFVGLLGWNPLQYAVDWFNARSPIVMVHTENFRVLDMGRLAAIGRAIKPTTSVDNPPFTLLYSDGTVINSPIYLMELSIWNRGATALSGDRLRRPIEIRLPGASRILGEVRTVHGDVRDIQAELPGSPATMVVSVRPSYLDPGEGFRLQVIYTASAPVRPSWNIQLVDTAWEDADVTVVERYPGHTIAVVASIWAVLWMLTFLASKHSSTARRIGLSVGIMVFIIVSTILEVNAVLLLTRPPF